MNIQIFGKSKCFDTKKAERYFKERRIKYQFIDLLRYGMSGKEFDSVLRAVGGIDNLIDWESKSQEVTNMRYMDDRIAKEDKVFDNPELMRTPVVRNGGDAGTPEADLLDVVKKREFVITCDFGEGSGEYWVWSSDLSHEYVTINADYHT